MKYLMEIRVGYLAILIFGTSGYLLCKKSQVPSGGEPHMPNSDISTGHRAQGWTVEPLFDEIDHINGGFILLRGQYSGTVISFDLFQ